MFYLTVNVLPYSSTSFQFLWEIQLEYYKYQKLSVLGLYWKNVCPFRFLNYYRHFDLKQAKPAMLF